MSADLFYTMLNAHAGIRDLLSVDLGHVPDFVLDAILPDLLESAVRISDELDARRLV
jgi:hypothetical protein